MGYSSFGGPGSRITLALSVSMIAPGAVPLWFSMTMAPWGSMACFQLLSVGSVPLSAKNLSMAFLLGSCRYRGLPQTFAAVSLVRSSSVGPSPPDRMTMSERPMAVSSACESLSSLSPTTV